jgi:glycosyltransferase involved in cell wall biosynthesis
MKNKPLVSCIIIFFNAEKFFEEAIESVFVQTYDNWELLLVDDGSTDSSKYIARHYAEKYPEKVSYLEHEAHQNRGMSASRNLGIRHSKGDYVALLDADDIWLPQKLEQQVAILEQHPEAAMVYSSTYVWYSWTGNPKDAQRDWEKGLGGFTPNSLVQPPTLLILLLQSKAHTPGTCSVLMRRGLIEDVGGFEESFRNLYEDQAFFAKVFLKAPIFLQCGRWDRYRQHPKNTCSIGEKAGQYHPFKPHPARFTYLNWLEKYLKEQGVNDPKLWRALRNSFLPYQHPWLNFLLRTYRSLISRLVSLFIQLGGQILPIPVRQWLWSKWENYQNRSPHSGN